MQEKVLLFLFGFQVFALAITRALANSISLCFGGPQHSLRLNYGPFPLLLSSAFDIFYSNFPDSHVIELH